MKYIAYIVTLVFIRLLALMPRWLLYFISDILSLELQYIFRYRRKVTESNLKNSFPDYSKKLLRQTTRKFYRHLTDIILENAVLLFYSKRRIEKMFSFSNKEILSPYYEQGRNIILMMAHYNNWEWASPLSYHFQHKFLAVYKPLRNPYFEKAYKKARTRHGAIAVPMGNIGRVLFEYNHKKIPTMTGMVGDQRPLRKKVKYWTDFLNQKTAVFTGSEKLAKKFDAVVVFMKIRKTKRGKYQAEFEIITETPGTTAEFEITEKYNQMLGKLIQEEPAYWLWSHNRWKVSWERWKDEQKKNNFKAHL